MGLHSGSRKDVPRGLAWTAPHCPPNFCRLACPGTAVMERLGLSSTRPRAGPSQPEGCGKDFMLRKVPLERQVLLSFPFYRWGN